MRARAALEQVFAPRGAAANEDDDLERAILTLLVEGHTSERGIQRCLAEQRRAVGLGTISPVLAEAEQRALQVLATGHALVQRFRSLLKSGEVALLDTWLAEG